MIVADVGYGICDLRCEIPETRGKIPHLTSPISHPANVLVMGPGGYRFIDYVKVGVPLTLVVLLVLMLILPVLWPLTP